MHFRNGQDQVDAAGLNRGFGHAIIAGFRWFLGDDQTHFVFDRQDTGATVRTSPGQDDAGRPCVELPRH